MQALFTALGRAFRSMLAPGMGSLAIACIIVALVAQILLTVMMLYATKAAALYFSGAGWSDGSFALFSDTGMGVFWLLVITGLLSTLLFPLILPVVVSFFDEAIAERIERFFYPKLALGTSRPFLEEFLADLRFTLKALLINILCLPLHFIPFFYYVLNAYLLGTQFFMMAGGRHIGRKAARVAARRHWVEVTLGGLVITLSAQVPVLSLIAPFFGVAIMVHLYQLVEKPHVVLEAERFAAHMPPP